ncbi:MAG: hypothetical protein JWQ00_2247 [Noviherbaspirillum sp.]|nr:hypothetical protein [Noviherbaspirillum sp.]
MTIAAGPMQCRPNALDAAFDSWVTIRGRDGGRTVGIRSADIAPLIRATGISRGATPDPIDFRPNAPLQTTVARDTEGPQTVRQPANRLDHDELAA